MIYTVRHATIYRYASPVTLSTHRLRLAPRATPRQTVRRFSIEVSPENHDLIAERDAFGNATHLLDIHESHSALIIEARSEVALAGQSPELGFTAWEAVAEAARRPSGAAALEAARDLTARIFHDFAYDPEATHASTLALDSFAARRGVCQDFAHVFLACCRALGVPARYVSGYLLTRPPEGKERMVGADASHAWASVWCPVSGWVDFDPTNDLIPSLEHVTCAWGRDYGDVGPVSGVVLGGGGHTIEVAVDVIPMVEVRE